MGEHRHSNRAIPIGNAEHELLQNIQGTTNNLDDGTGTDIHAHDNIASNNTAGGLLVDPFGPVQQEDAPPLVSGLRGIESQILALGGQLERCHDIETATSEIDGPNNINDYRNRDRIIPMGNTEHESNPNYQQGTSNDHNLVHDGRLGIDPRLQNDDTYFFVFDPPPNVQAGISNFLAVSHNIRVSRNRDGRSKEERMSMDSQSTQSFDSYQNLDYEMFPLY